MKKEAILFLLIASVQGFLHAEAIERFEWKGMPFLSDSIHRVLDEKNKKLPEGKFEIKYTYEESGFSISILKNEKVILKLPSSDFSNMFVTDFVLYWCNYRVNTSGAGVQVFALDLKNEKLLWIKRYKPFQKAGFSPWHQLAYIENDNNNNNNLIRLVGMEKMGNYTMLINKTDGSIIDSRTWSNDHLYNQSGDGQ